MLFAVWTHYIFGISLSVMSVFLILLVLIQRGRGGGLTGALGGMGGQSAFGTKAGDLFTRVTIVAAAVWLLLCVLAIGVLNSGTTKLGPPTTGIGTPGVGEEEAVEVEPDGTGGILPDAVVPETPPGTPPAGETTD